MRIILKSGYIIDNVIPNDSTKSVVGLWIWSTKQIADQILTFENLTVRSSEIAAIEGNEDSNVNIEKLPWEEGNK